MARKCDNIYSNIIRMASTPEEALLMGIIAQAYKDYRAGDTGAKYFLESFETGRRVLEMEEKIYGESLPKRKHYKA